MQTHFVPVCAALLDINSDFDLAFLAGQMATLDKAEALLEELRVASVEAARRDLDEITAFAAEQARRKWFLEGALEGVLLHNLDALRQGSARWFCHA